MADLNDLSKPDLVSNYSTEVLQTIRAHITRLWTGDYSSMGGLVANMRRWIDLGGGNAKLVKRNVDGSETTIFDSSTKVSQTYVDTAVSTEATARAADIINEVANRDSAISAEATARSNADALKADKGGANAAGTWPISITGDSANGGVKSVNGKTGDVIVTSSYIGARAQLFTSSGTFTIPTGVTALKVAVVGGGGNGGEGDNSGIGWGNYGGGGGSGGSSLAYLTGLTSGLTLTVTVGGIGGTSSVASGSQSITTIQCTGGGTGGWGGGNGNLQGSAGTASGGTLNINGQTGQGSAGGSSVGLGGLGGGFGRSDAPAYAFGGGGGGSPPASGRGGSGGYQGIVSIEW